MVPVVVVDVDGGGVVVVVGDVVVGGVVVVVDVVDVVVSFCFDGVDAVGGVVGGDVDGVVVVSSDGVETNIQNITCNLVEHYIFWPGLKWERLQLYLNSLRFSVQNLKQIICIIFFNLFNNL